MKYKISARRNPQTKQTIFCPASVNEKSITLPKIAKRIKEETSLSRTEVISVLGCLQNLAVEELANGNIVRLGLLGTLRPTICAKGVLTKEEATPERIRGIRIAYTPSTEVKQHLSPSALPFEKVENE